MTEADLQSIQARLSRLDDQLRRAQNRLRDKENTSADHHATNRDLRERHQRLMAMVKRDEDSARRAGQEVGDIERSLHTWIARLDQEGI